MTGQVGITNMKKRKRRVNIGYYWAEGIRNIFLHGFMSFAAVSIIVACLLITGSVALITYNIDLNIKQLQDKSEIVIFIDENLSDDEARALQSTLEQIENVSTVTFRSREEALENLREKDAEYSTILQGFDDSNNPLRNEYHITLQDVTKTEETVDKIVALPQVANHRVQEDTISMLVKVQNVFKIVSLSLVVALGCISVFIISNTVKLAMFSRREEISIQKMVGATNWFIRWPFVIEGMVLGFIGGILALFIEWGVYAKLSGFVVGMLPMFQMAAVENLYSRVITVFMAASVAVGMCGSVLTIRRFMDV